MGYSSLTFTMVLFVISCSCSLSNAADFVISIDSAVSDKANATIFGYPTTDPRLTVDRAQLSSVVDPYNLKYTLNISGPGAQTAVTALELLLPCEQGFVEVGKRGTDCDTVAMCSNTTAENKTMEWNGKTLKVKDKIYKTSCKKFFAELRRFNETDPDWTPFAILQIQATVEPTHPGRKKGHGSIAKNLMIACGIPLGIGILIIIVLITHQCHRRQQNQPIQNQPNQNQRNQNNVISVGGSVNLAQGQSPPQSSQQTSPLQGPSNPLHDRASSDSMDSPDVLTVRAQIESVPDHCSKDLSLSLRSREVRMTSLNPEVAPEESATEEVPGGGMEADKATAISDETDPSREAGKADISGTGDEKTRLLTSEPTNEENQGSRITSTIRETKL